jgi:hypothetical protein
VFRIVIELPCEPLEYQWLQVAWDVLDDVIEAARVEDWVGRAVAVYDEYGTCHYARFL